MDSHMLMKAESEWDGIVKSLELCNYYSQSQELHHYLLEFVNGFQQIPKRYLDPYFPLHLHWYIFNLSDLQVSYTHTPKEHVGD